MPSAIKPPLAGFCNSIRPVITPAPTKDQRRTTKERLRFILEPWSFVLGRSSLVVRPWSFVVQ
jgi:hypothetical protein